MAKTRLAVCVLWGIGVLVVECMANPTECTKGSRCFPDGVLPAGLTDNDFAYYCCLGKNTTRVQNETQSCSCVSDLTLDSRIQRWADESKDEGPMCIYGGGCGPGMTNSSINGRFTFCCWADGHQILTAFDSDKLEYIGCRCTGGRTPSPDPSSYVVPPVVTYSSTGESCSYDEDCQDHPSLKCQSPSVTFCCYGSRGMVTTNDGDSLTRCTCTNTMFGEHCASNPVAMDDTRQNCIRDCADKADKADDKKCSHGNDTRCCANNMAAMTTVYEGRLATCTCKAQGPSKCNEPSSSASRVSWRLSDVIALAAAVLCWRSIIALQ